MLGSIELLLGPVAARTAGDEVRALLERLLTRRMGATVRVGGATSYAEVSERVRTGSTHFAWLPPVLLVRAMDEAGAQPLVSAMRMKGATYHGVLFVPREHPARDVAALRGTRVAWVDERSASGYLFPRLALAAHDAGSGFFAREVFLGSHRAVVSAVRDGRADVGATFAQSIGGPSDRPAASGWDDIGLEAMRPILWSAEIPADAVCATPSADTAMRKRLEELFLCLHLDPDGRIILRDLFQARGFEPTTPQHHDDTRRALQLVMAR